MTASSPGPRVSDDIVAIGDIQGCFDCFQALLGEVDRQFSSPRLWLCGDLVNRGPKSLEILRWAKANTDRLICVLGNHDLHLLAVLAGARTAGRNDTLGAILSAPDRDELVDWLRTRPLAHLENGHLLVHAGVLPQWSAAAALERAHEVERVLRTEQWPAFVQAMYGDMPRSWRDDLAGTDRLRVIVNALTRLRFCRSDGRMEFATKEGVGAAPAGYQPWFEVAERASRDVTVVFGHWSTLGLYDRPGLLGLDTGCVWGGELTAVRLSDRARLQVACPRAVTPGPG